MSKYTEKNMARKGHSKNGETRLARQLRRTMLVGETHPPTPGAFGSADKDLFDRLAAGTRGEGTR